MNIGVITFSDFNTNYGSMLQALSMKIYLENIGHNVTFIRYREYNKPISKQGINIVKCFVRRNLLLMYTWLHRADRYKTIANFQEFQNTFFKYTKLYTSNEELSQMEEKFDAVICGSDQIWNLECLGGLRTAYFMKFVSEKIPKIFYAASMGDYHFNNDDIKVIKPLLDRSTGISVREKENVKEVQSITDNIVYNVVDPVFLNSSQKWESLASKRIIDGDYGICYFVRRSKFGRNIVNKIRKKYNMPIFNLSDNLIYIKGTNDDYISVDPIGFISLVKHAKFVVGTSFHLAAFSLLFKVPAIICGMESNRSRIMNIFQSVGLENHYVTPDSDLSILDRFMEDEIKLEKMNNDIQKSKQYLIDFLLKS